VCDRIVVLQQQPKTQHTKKRRVESGFLKNKFKKYVSSNKKFEETISQIFKLFVFTKVGL